MCVRTCKLENETPYDAPVTRAWVERYVLLKDGKLFADTPLGARDGFTISKIDLGLGRYQDIRKEDIDKAYFVPKPLQPVRKPALCAGLPGRRHLPDRGRGRPCRQKVVYRLWLLHYGMSLWREVLPSCIRSGRKMQFLLSQDNQRHEDRLCRRMSFWRQTCR